MKNNLQPEVIAATTICLSAAYISVVLRFISRRIGGTALGKDDFTIVIGLITASVFSILIIVLTTFGLGRHQDTLTPTESIKFAKGCLAAETVLNVPIVTIKLSILLLYHRIFVSPRFTRALWATGIFLVSWCFASAMVDIFQCVPVQALWDPTIPHKCVNVDGELIAVSLLNVISDVLILILPLPMLWGLHTTTQRKWQLTGLFLMGSLVCVGSIVRTVYSSQVSLTDASWDNTKPAMWSAVEINLAIVSACLPTLRPLTVYLFRGSYTGNTKSDTNSRSMPLGVFKSVKTTQRYGTNSAASYNENAYNGDFVKLTSGMDVEISAGKGSDTESGGRY